MTKQPEENWEKQIRKGVQVFDRKVYAIPYAGQMYEKLARELILSERKRVVERVEEKKTIKDSDLNDDLFSQWDIGYNVALSDVIRLIEGK